MIVLDYGVILHRPSRVFRFDGDGYSDPDGSWTTANGADAFISDPTQWADSDIDGFGDNPLELHLMIV